MKNPKFRPYLVRLGWVFLGSFIAVLLISEVGVRLQRENTARAPKTFELTIPDGTAAKVEAGEEAPGIPGEMSFVLGDILLVHNMDQVAHTLGPLLIPAGTSAEMPLDQADNLTLSCSFTPSNFLGLDVRRPTTWLTRLAAYGFAVPPTMAMIYVYSLLAFPIGEKKEEQEQ